MFKKLSDEKVSVVESKISEKWEEMDILARSLENKKNTFVFYDGPATANGFPGLHHMIAKFLKDSFCKYKTMQGNTTEHINEHFQLTPIDNIDFFISLAIFFGILMLTDRKIRLSDFFMFGGLTILALKMRRQVSMYVLFGTTIIAKLVDSFFTKFDKKVQIFADFL